MGGSLLPPWRVPRPVADARRLRPGRLLGSQIRSDAVSRGTLSASPQAVTLLTMPWRSFLWDTGVLHASFATSPRRLCDCAWLDVSHARSGSILRVKPGHVILCGDAFAQCQWHAGKHTSQYG